MPEEDPSIGLVLEELGGVAAAIGSPAVAQQQPVGTVSLAGSVR